MKIARLLALTILLPTFTFAEMPAKAAKQASSIPVLGHWDAALTVDRRSGAPFSVGFGIELEGSTSPNGLRALLVNGSDKKEFTRVRWEDGRLALWIGEYEGELKLSCENANCSSLAGEYSRLTRMGQMHYKVTAVRHTRESTGPGTVWSEPSLSGNWQFKMRSPDGKTEEAPARFEQKSARRTNDATVAEVEGTVAAVSGDYGTMHGAVLANSKVSAEPTFRISRFDGIHTTLIDGVILPDGSLKGTIAYSPLATVEFTATRSNKNGEAGSKAANEAESLTKMRDANAVFRFSGVDPRTGKTMTQAEFSGKPLIVDIFGTWCPNCHDEAPVLGEMYRRYHRAGLEVVGLSFEYTDDTARNARLIDFFRKKYDVGYRLLSAGTTDDAEKKLSELDGFGVYPTTIFIDRKGKVRAIHAGFEGAATGQLEELKMRFEELVKQIVASE